MPRSGLAGSRIREQRQRLGLKQAALAQTVGISPTYLNLIEHNKRRIGGKLLVDLAQQLDVEPSLLSEGAESTLIAALRDAASGRGEVVAEEVETVDSFAGRYPGWAQLIVAQHRRIVALEQTAEALYDRLTHDPQLAASMHEVLSVVTAIRSTSAILADTSQLDPDWQARFHRNLYEDSQRLAESSQALVQYLDSTPDGDADQGLTLPQEELEGWLTSRLFHIAELEIKNGPSVEEILNGPDGFSGSSAAMEIAHAYLAQYKKDATDLPLHNFQNMLEDSSMDPAAIAAHFGTDLVKVFRRMAAMPGNAGKVGLVQCDGSGTMTFRKPIDGFALPRFGAACPLWPLYQALAAPMSPKRQVVEQSGRTPQKFITYAMSQPIVATGFDVPPVYQSSMLIVPFAQEQQDPHEAVLPIGSSCRICPREGCVARREPSILIAGF